MVITQSPENSSILITVRITLARQSQPAVQGTVFTAGWAVSLPLPPTAWGHQPVPRGWTGLDCWSLGWAPCFCLKDVEETWHRPEVTVTKLYYHNPIKCVWGLLSCRSGWEEGRRGLPVGGFVAKESTAAKGEYDMLAYLHLYLS